MEHIFFCAKLLWKRRIIDSLFVLGSGSGSDSESERRSEKEGRSLRTTVMPNLMKASKFLVSSGKNSTSRFSVKDYQFGRVFGNTWQNVSAKFL